MKTTMTTDLLQVIEVDLLQLSVAEDSFPPHREEM